ncbi:uncharacterized protein LOC126851768 isoform X2 [Cataglyphis hispanica]|nr:uncharacterized protein LOC126851768 isoform X2 [Cataglyphis hispanica]XP_050452049.1 uncharacterized protein LOC126851768 isoform X2 [Cataglyphis hispanica]
MNYSHSGWKCSDNDNGMSKRNELSSEITEDEADVDQEINEDEESRADVQRTNINNEEKEGKTEQDDTQIGECAICHVIINDINFSESVDDSGQNPYESYLLCQRCVRKFSIQSGVEHFQCRRSHTSFSQNKDCSDRVAPRRTYDRPIVMYLQPPSSHSTSKLRRNWWACNFNRTMVEATDDESDTISFAVVDHDRSNLQREEQTKSYEKQCQQQFGYRNMTTTTTTTTRRNDATDRYTSEIKVKNSSLASSVECSRRPIRCPRLDCSMNVAFSALTHHFLFDHPEVPILSVEPGAESTLIVSYGALSCNSSRCLALLLVSGKLSDSTARLFGGNQINPKYRNRLPLPVLAARLHNNHNYACCEEMHAGGEGQCEKDMIIAWVAGLDIGDTVDRLRCSIQAVDSIENRGFRSLTYTGPVTSLRAAQCPRDVFLAGDCIVLHEGLISHITFGCTSLNVNVIVH